MIVQCEKNGLVDLHHEPYLFRAFLVLREFEIGFLPELLDSPNLTLVVALLCSNGDYFINLFREVLEVQVKDVLKSEGLEVESRHIRFDILYQPQPMSLFEVRIGLKLLNDWVQGDKAVEILV